MKIFFVGGVDTNVGKTFVVQQVIHFLHSKNIKALAIKPIETGVDEISLDSSDSMLHLLQARAFFSTLDFDEVNFYSFSLSSAPSVADVQKTISLEEIFEKISAFQNRGVEVLIIEGAGGLFTPIKNDYFMLSFAKDLEKHFCSQTILICDDRLGMINRFLSAKFILDSLQMKTLFFVNIRNQEIFASINFPFMKHYDFEVEIKSLANQLLKG